MSLRMLDEAGRGYVSWAVEALEYAATHRAQVAVCPWGGAAESRFLREALERAVATDMAVVVAAGNDGLDLSEQGWY
ncbi:S8 family serine peptidase, partial [Escherichia coli]|nr:S8 family serine peptidase [Escherichia coli]